MVTDMNYNTVAQISDGNITSAENINVNSNSNITAITEALSASAGALAIGGWILSKRVKLKTPQFLTNLKPKLQNGYQQVKTAVSGGLDKIKNLFKKKKP